MCCLILIIQPLINRYLVFLFKHRMIEVLCVIPAYGKRLKQRGCF